MIKDFFFILKMLGFTVLIAMTMAVKVGNTSLDEQFDHWVKTSIFVDYLQEAIDGGIALTRVGYKKADSGVRSVLAKVSKHHKKDANPLSLHLHRYNEDEDGNVTSESPQAQVHSGKIH